MSEGTTGGVSRRSFLAGAAGTGTLLIAGCTQQTGGNGNGGNGGGDGDGGLSGTIDIAGSSTVFPLAVEMRSRFQEEHPDVSINIQSTGSGGGFQNHFCPGDTEFNNASRPIQSEEEQLCSDNDVEPVELTVATDALTIIVNNDADWIDCVTPDELAQIWSGESRPSTWREVNDDWPDEEFELYGPTDASGTFDYFHETIVGEDTDMRRDYQATEQDQQIIQGVQNSEYAMGYMGFSYYSQNEDSVKGLEVDDGDGCVAPSLETARAGEYTPLSRPLFTYPAKSALAEDHVAEFARFFVENSTSQEIVDGVVGYVPNDEETKTEMMDRLATAIEDASE